MSIGEWTLRSLRVVTPTGLRGADVAIRGELIVSVLAHDDRETSGVVLDAGDRLVLPGLVGLHAGTLDAIETGDLNRLTRASASSGVTTLVDLPFDLGPRPTSIGDFAARCDALHGRSWVDFGFTTPLTSGNASEVDRLIDAGALGFKTWLDRSDSEPKRFPALSPDQLRAPMRLLAQAGRPVLAVELSGSPRDSKAIRKWIELCRETRCPVHLVHFANLEAMPEILEARAEGLPLTLDVGIDDLISPMSGPDLTTPPARDRLWDALKAGQIDAIGASRSPDSPRLDFPVIWFEGRSRGASPEDLARWMSGRPSELLGLATRKGKIAPGFDADFLVFDPEARPGTSSGASSGRVVSTILRGSAVRTSPSDGDRPRGVVMLPLGETQPIAAGLDQLNEMAQIEAIDAFRRCCASTRWAYRMEALRPFASIANLIEAADGVWQSVERADRLEAFAAHARPEPFDASEDTRMSLADGHQAYEQKFGHVLIVGPEVQGSNALLDHLWRRLSHHIDTEMKFSSDEQTKLTRYRIRQFFE